MAKQTINIGAVANDGTGDKLRVAFEKTNDNFTELYEHKSFGIWNYNNNAGSQAITSSTWTKVVNNGAGANTILGGALSGVTIYDNAISQNLNFTGLNLYDTCFLRFDGNITTTSPNQEVKVRVVLSYGVLNIPLTFISRVFKTSGVNEVFGALHFGILSNSVLNNPARIEIWSDASATLNLNGYYIEAHKRTM